VNATAVAKRDILSRRLYPVLGDDFGNRYDGWRLLYPAGRYLFGKDDIGTDFHRFGDFCKRRADTPAKFFRPSRTADRLYAWRRRRWCFGSG
jgi:hypothetical protein